MELEEEGSRALVSDEAGRRRRVQAGELGLLDQEGRGKSGAVVLCSPASSSEARGSTGARRSRGGRGRERRGGGCSWDRARTREAEETAVPLGLG